MFILPPTILATRNRHPNDSNIQFESVQHLYTVYNDASRIYTSVTTWCNSNFNPFDADKIIAYMMQSRKWNESNKYWGQTPTQIKELWKRSGTDASTAGTLLHERIENFMNCSAMVSPSPEYSHANLLEHYIRTDPDFMAASDPLEWFWFIDFVSSHPRFIPYRTEWYIYDDTVNIAGSVDMVYKNTDDESLSIYDWKRCKCIDSTTPQTSWISYSTNPVLRHIIDTKFWHYALQLNVYRHIIETRYGKRVRDMWLVRLHPESSGYELIEIPRMEAEMSALFAQRLGHALT
jgi:hypothetical protein